MYILHPLFVRNMSRPAHVVHEGKRSPGIFKNLSIDKIRILLITGYYYGVVSYKASHTTATIFRSTVPPSDL
jgi:hypothetical protein